MTTTFKKTTIKIIQVFQNHQTATFLRVKDYNLLLEVKFKQLYIPLPCDDSSCVRYKYEHDGNTLTYAPNEIELYRNKEAYQAGEQPLPLVDFRVPCLEGKHCSGQIVDEDNEIVFTAWKMDVSTPKEVDAPIKGIIIDEIGIAKFDYIPDNLDDYYPSRKEALRYNSFAYFNQEGKYTECEGTHAFSRLTFEQELVVNDLRRVLQEAKEKDIKLYFDSLTQDIYTINGKRAYIDWTDPAAEDELNCFDPEELHPTSVIKDAMYGTNTDDSYYKVVEVEPKQEGE